MRSLHFIGTGRLEWRDAPVPRLQGDGEALVTPVAASICDIDRPIIEGTSPFEGPFAIGHEGIARVIEVGDAVETIAPGELVVVTWHIACGTCPRCRQGLTAHCDQTPPQAMYGLPAGGEWGGLFDDMVRVPFADAMVTPIPGAVAPLDAVAAGDNLSLGLEIIRPHLAAGRRRILVLGYRAVALYQVLFAAGLGADEIVYVDDDPGRRAIAEAAGATAVPGPPDRSLGRFDLVVDASFNESWLRRASRMLQPDGVLECLGGYFGDVSLPAFAMYANGATIRIGRANTGPHVQPTLDAVAAGTVTPSAVYSEIVAWDDAPAALAQPSLKPVFARPELVPAQAGTAGRTP